MTAGLTFTAAVLMSVMITYGTTGSPGFALIPVAAGLLLCVAWQRHRQRKEQRQEVTKRLLAHAECRRKLCLSWQERLTRGVEREMKAALKMPPGHPESLTASLDADQEDWLVKLAADLWPDGRYRVKQDGGQP